MPGASREDAVSGRLPDPAFWSGKKVLITGHSGFKGSWLGLWLSRMGADLFGYSEKALPSPSLYALAGIDRLYPSALGDIRDGTRLTVALTAFKPDIVLHLAAQPLIPAGYRSLAETFEVNAIGTARLLDAVLRTDSVRSVVVVTSDKCHENPAGPVVFREGEPLGGADPYSASKACAELVTAAYRRSFFGPGAGRHPAAVATACAGNVIGGGDFAEGRLAPDVVRAWAAKREPQLRLPGAVRPWQHVLEPLAGYLRLAEELWAGGETFAGPWNFGPPAADCRTAGWLAAELATALRGEAAAELAAALRAAGAEGAAARGQGHEREALSLRLDSSLAEARLGWRSRWTASQAIAATADWYRAWANEEELQSFSLAQLASYVAANLDHSLRCV